MLGRAIKAPAGDSCGAAGIAAACVGVCVV